MLKLVCFNFLIFGQFRHQPWQVVVHHYGLSRYYVLYYYSDFNVLYVDSVYSKVWKSSCDLYRIEESKSGNDTLSVGETVQGWLRDSFDNDATPFFALIICLWGETFIITICSV